MTANNSHRALNLYVLPGALFAFTYVLFGYHYQTSDDALVSALIRGFPFGVPVTEFFFCHRLTSHLYAHLAQAYPGVPWYEFAMYGLLFLAVRNYFAVIYDYAKRFLPAGALTPLLIVAYSVFFLNSVIFINFTEVAIYLSSSALVLAVTRLTSPIGSAPFAYASVVGYLSLFAVALMTRPQGALLSLIVLLPLGILQRRDAIVRCVCCVYLPAFALVGALQLYDYATWNDDSAYFRSVFPYVFNVLDARTPTTPLDGPADSMRYWAITHWFLGDRETTNVAFLSRMVRNDSIDFRKVSVAGLWQTLEQMYEMGSKYQIAGALLLPLLGAAAVALRRQAKDGWRILWFTAFYWLPVVALALCWKMPDRVLTPSIISYTLAASVFAFALIEHNRIWSWSYAKGGGFIAGIWCLALVVTLVAWRQKAPGADIEAEKTAKNIKFRQELTSDFPGRTVVFTMDTLNAFVKHQPALSTHRLAENSAYILIDSSWPTLLPQYPQHLREKTGTDRLASVFQYLREKSDSVILVSTPERNAMMQKYLAAVYHDRYVFDPLRPNVPLNQDGAGLYVIK